MPQDHCTGWSLYLDLHVAQFTSQHLPQRGFSWCNPLIPYIFLISLFLSLHSNYDYLKFLGTYLLVYINSGTLHSTRVRHNKYIVLGDDTCYLFIKNKADYEERDMGYLRRDLKEMREWSVWISRGKAFQIKEMASPKALMQEHACPACGTPRRLLCEEVQGRVVRLLRALWALVKDFGFKSEWNGESL